MGAQENVRVICDQLQVRPASDLRVFKSMCILVAMQLRYMDAFASIFRKSMRVSRG